MYFAKFHKVIIVHERIERFPKQFIREISRDCRTTVTRVRKSTYYRVIPLQQNYCKMKLIKFDRRVAVLVNSVTPDVH